MTSTVNEASASATGGIADASASEDEGAPAWMPPGGVLVAPSKFERVAERLHGAPNPVLGRSSIELLVARYLRDGTFDSDDPESIRKVRELAKLAFAEEASQRNFSVEELERAFKGDVVQGQGDTQP